MKRYDFCFFERSETKFSGEVRIGGVTVISFNCEKSVYDFKNESLKRTPLSRYEWNKLKGHLIILANYHFGQHYIWIEDEVKVVDKST